MRVRKADWPILAQGRDSHESHNGTPLPRYESSYWRLTVRQHADGRAVVYGVADLPEPCWRPGDAATDWRGGETLPAATEADRGPFDDDVLAASRRRVAAAIQRVGADLVRHGGAPESVIRECIADLPATDLDAPAGDTVRS